MNRIYLDHAATTPMDPTVFESMRPWLTDFFGNASTLYESGRRVRMAIDDARDTVAAHIGAASPGEIVFTSGGSESDNMAIKGTALALQSIGKHIVVSSIEHQAVIESAKSLEKLGFNVSFIPADQNGIIHPDAVKEALTDETIIVSVMHANNEIGTIQPIQDIAKVVKERDIVFHVDAVQSAPYLHLSVQQLGCDLMSLSAHKVYGPKGIGALYVKKGTPLLPLIDGGGQEQERRAGTENAAYIIGFAQALDIVASRREEDSATIRALRDRLGLELMQQLPDSIWFGQDAPRLPGHLNLAFPGTEGESVLLNLDMHGIEASSGSACTAGSIEESHVLRAMGFPRDTALASVRMTLGRHNTEDDIDRVIQTLPQVVHRLRDHDMI